MTTKKSQLILRKFSSPFVTGKEGRGLSPAYWSLEVGRSGGKAPSDVEGQSLWLGGLTTYLHLNDIFVNNVLMLMSDKACHYCNAVFACLDVQFSSNSHTEK